MKVIGYREVKIRNIKLPGNWAAILKDPQSRARGKSMTEVGQIQDPVVRQSDKMLITGRRRVAGHILEHRKTCMVKMVECTDDEAREWEELENIERRHDADYQGDLIARRLDRFEAAEKKKDLESGEEPAKGPRTRAREELAKERNITPESVRKAEARFKMKGKKRKSKRRRKMGDPIKLSEGPTIKTLGMEEHIELNEDFLEEVDEIQERFRSAANKTKAALAILATINRSNLSFPKGRLTQLRQELQLVNASLAGAVPYSICPWCKALDISPAQCQACIDEGYITYDQKDGIPDELLDVGKPILMVSGKEYPLKEVLDKQEGPDNPWGV